MEQPGQLLTESEIDDLIEKARERIKVIRLKRASTLDHLIKNVDHFNVGVAKGYKCFLNLLDMAEKHCEVGINQLIDVKRYGVKDDYETRQTQANS